MEVRQVLAFNSSQSGLYDYAKLYVEDASNILVISDMMASGSPVFDNAWNRVRILNRILDSSSSVHVIDNTPRTLLFIIIALGMIRDRRFIVTIHDPREHSVRGLKNRLRRSTKNILNILLVGLTHANRNLIIHFHESCYLSSLCKNAIVFPHPTYRTLLNNHSGNSPRKGDRLNIGWFGRASYNKGYDIFCELVKSLENEVEIDFVACGIDESSALESSNLDNYCGYLHEEAFDSLLLDVDLVMLPYRDVTSSGILAKCISYDVPWLASTSFHNEYQCGLVVQPNKEEFLKTITTFHKERKTLNDHIKKCKNIISTHKCVSGKDLYARI